MVKIGVPKMKGMKNMPNMTGGMRGNPKKMMKTKLMKKPLIKK